MLKPLVERIHFRRCQRGNIAIETAFAIPILVSLAVGAAEYGRAYSVKSELANVARAGAQAAIEFSGDDESLSYTVQSNLVQAGLISDPAGEGFDTSSEPQTEVASYCTCPGGAAVACDGSCSGDDLPRRYVQVTVTLPFSMMVPMPGLTDSLTLSETVSMRME
ncbi:MAG: TadE/TadG family type IV pilus assembly protein [Alphaproteobacteria bacterium]